MWVIREVGTISWFRDPISVCKMCDMMSILDPILCHRVNIQPGGPGTRQSQGTADELDPISYFLASFLGRCPCGFREDQLFKSVKSLDLEKEKEKLPEMLLRLRSARGQQRVTVNPQESLNGLIAQVAAALGVSGAQVSCLVISDSSVKVSLTSHAQSTPIGKIFK